MIRDFLWTLVNRQVASLDKSTVVSPFRRSLLTNILSYAVANVPAYAGCSPNSLNSFPILTKNKLINDFDSFKSLSYEGPTSLTYSGGSTGAPVPILHCPNYFNHASSSLNSYYRSILGKSWQSSTTLEIWGSRDDLASKNFLALRGLKGSLSASYFFNCFDLSQSQIEACIDLIIKHSPLYIKGYTNSLVEIANFIITHKLSIPSPKFVLPRSSVLSEHHRYLIEQAFGCPTVDLYGSREVSTIAAELPYFPGRFHVFNELHFLEVQPDGQLLITNFHNWSMPIIRFSIGDCSTLLYSSEQSQVIGPIQGRVYDYLTFSQGKRIHSQFFISLFFDIGIFQFSVRQSSFDSISIIYVDPYSRLSNANKLSIQSAINLATQQSIHLTWEKTTLIPKSRHGKYLYVKGL